MKSIRPRIVSEKYWRSVVRQGFLLYQWLLLALLDIVRSQIHMHVHLMLWIFESCTHSYMGACAYTWEQVCELYSHKHGFNFVMQRCGHLKPRRSDAVVSFDIPPPHSLPPNFPRRASHGALHYVVPLSLLVTGSPFPFWLFPPDFRITREDRNCSLFDIL